MLLTTDGLPPFIFRNEFGSGLNRKVDRIEREVEKKGAVPIRLDERHGLGGQPAGQVFALWTVGELGISVRTEIPSHGASRLVPPHVEVKALARGCKCIRPQMPLSHVGCNVARLLEEFGEGDLREGKIRNILHWNHAAELLASSGPRGDRVNPCPGTVASRHQSRPRGRAVGVGIGIREPRAVPGQRVDVGGLIKAAAIRTQVGPAQIIGHDEDDIRRSGQDASGRRTSDCAKQRDQHNTSEFHLLLRTLRLCLLEECHKSKG